MVSKRSRNDQAGIKKNGCKEKSGDQETGRKKEAGSEEEVVKEVPFPQERGFLFLTLFVRMNEKKPARNGITA